MDGRRGLSICSRRWIGVGRVEGLVRAIRCNDTCKISGSHAELNIQTVECEYERVCIAPTINVITRALSSIQVKAQIASCCLPRVRLQSAGVEWSVCYDFISLHRSRTVNSLEPLQEFSDSAPW